jgi:hypothetical protein
MCCPSSQIEVGRQDFTFQTGSEHLPPEEFHTTPP